MLQRGTLASQPCDIRHRLSKLAFSLWLSVHCEHLCAMTVLARVTGAHYAAAYQLHEIFTVLHS